jgi:CheY-like chemotaxis protein
MDRKHILVADDQENTLLTMEFILKAANYQVTTAGNGQEALDKIIEAERSGSPVDLLITDIQMPCLTGLELMDELNRAKIDIPILVITGCGNEELVIALMRKGCDGCLDKPINEEELIKRLTMLFGEKH